ncbi:MAG: excisionase family DNA-binding protein [Acidimicrobiales bacterium]
MVVSVTEAADRLGVSSLRVRQLIASGRLAADRVGGRYVIAEADLDRFGVLAAHRPWKPGSVWGLLWLIENRPVPWLTAKQLQRARGRAEQGLRAHLDVVGSRAASAGFRAHGSAIRRLGMDARLVRSGVSALGDVGVDLVGGVDEVEGYVRRKDLDRIASDYGLVAERARPNVWLHVVDDPWPFENGEEVAPPLVVALDLLDHDDERLQRAGRDLLSTVLGDGAP